MTALRFLSVSTLLGLAVEVGFGVALAAGIVLGVGP